MLAFGKIIESKNINSYEIRAQEAKHPMGDTICIRILKNKKPFIGMKMPKSVRAIADSFIKKYKTIPR